MSLKKKKLPDPLPCPCCYGDIRVCVLGAEYCRTYWIRCQHCFVRTPEKKTLKEVLDIWNRRPSLEDISRLEGD